MPRDFDQIIVVAQNIVANRLMSSFYKLLTASLSSHSCDSLTNYSCEDHNLEVTRRS